MSKPWTEAEIKLLGTKPDFELGRELGRPGKTVWAKRRALGIAASPVVRYWTEAEDGIIRSQSVSEAAKILNRTEMAVRIRRRKLGLETQGSPKPHLLTTEEARHRIEVGRYDTLEQEEKFKLISGPYSPPVVPIGGHLKCELRGDLKVGGYTNAIIPWPVALNHAKQLILCGDLVRALKTESRAAVVFHFGISPQWISEYRGRLGIERFTPGSMRLFWRTVNLARTPEARKKMSRQREGRKDLMLPEDREKLRAIQQRPKSKEWKVKMSERQQRRNFYVGHPEKWTVEELKLIGSRPDREVAKMLNRSLSAVKAKKFDLLKQTRNGRTERCDNSPKPLL